MAFSPRHSVLRDTRGASSAEYLGILGTVAVIGIAGFMGLGGGMGDAIGGEGNGGGMATSSQAGEVVTADHPNTGGGSGGGGGGNGGGGGSVVDPGGFAVGDGAGLVSGGVPNVLDRVGGGEGGGGGNLVQDFLNNFAGVPRTIGNPILKALDVFGGGGSGGGGESGSSDDGGGLLDGLVNLATLPARTVKSVISGDDSEGGGLGGSCLNPLNMFGCATDFVSDKKKDLEDVVVDQVLHSARTKTGDKGPEICVSVLGFETCRPMTRGAADLPDPDEDDFRVLTINAANGHTCEPDSDDAVGDLHRECNGDKDYYRTKENRARLAKLANDSQADVVALQEVFVGKGSRGGGLDTGLRTAAQTNDSFSVFLEGYPVTDYALVAMGEKCTRLPCKQISPDGTIIYRTDDGTYVAGVSICSGGKDNKCPDGTKRNKDGSFEDPYFGSWDVAEHGHTDTDDNGKAKYENGKAKKKTKMQRPDDEDVRYGTSVLVTGDQQVTDAYTVVLPPALTALPSIAGPKTRAMLADYNNAMRDSYAEAKAADKKDDDTLQHYEPRTALVTIVTSPDGTERAVINVHLGLRGDVDGVSDIQKAQLAAVADLAKQEAANGREVVVTGDFNMQVDVVGNVFEDAGLSHAGGTDIDQVWASTGVETKEGSDIRSDGASDHDVGATATLE